MSLKTSKPPTLDTGNATSKPNLKQRFTLMRKNSERSTLKLYIKNNSITNLADEGLYETLDNKDREPPQASPANRERSDDPPPALPERNHLDRDRRRTVDCSSHYRGDGPSSPPVRHLVDNRHTNNVPESPHSNGRLASDPSNLRRNRPRRSRTQECVYTSKQIESVPYRHTPVKATYRLGTHTEYSKENNIKEETQSVKSYNSSSETLSRSSADVGDTTNNGFYKTQDHNSITDLAKHRKPRDRSPLAPAPSTNDINLQQYHENVPCNNSVREMEPISPTLLQSSYTDSSTSSRTHFKNILQKTSRVTMRVLGSYKGRDQSPQRVHQGDVTRECNTENFQSSVHI